MTVHTLLPPAPRIRLDSPTELINALGISFSAQQLQAITAPLQPGVIIAGAGSGKTTVMAARVVWLVGTGAVRPEEVLGLTFTRKAAAELSQRVRNALLRAGVIADRGVDESGEQLIMTYDAFAARLVAEHGLRLGFEADPTLISGATRYRLASRVVKAAAGPFEFISRLRPATVTERVLRLDADLQQHLVMWAIWTGMLATCCSGWQRRRATTEATPMSTSRRRSLPARSVSNWPAWYATTRT
jgi:DNA helicase-2/ATP-dependent DNA helicase PcrA